jgi:hypothetical protein
MDSGLSLRSPRNDSEEHFRHGNGRDKPGHFVKSVQQVYRSAFSPWAERVRNFWVIGTIMS